MTNPLYIKKNENKLDWIAEIIGTSTIAKMYIMNKSEQVMILMYCTNSEEKCTNEIHPWCSSSIICDEMLSTDPRHNLCRIFYNDVLAEQKTNLNWLSDIFRDYIEFFNILERHVISLGG